MGGGVGVGAPLFGVAPMQEKTASARSSRPEPSSTDSSVSSATWTRMRGATWTRMRGATRREGAVHAWAGSARAFGTLAEHDLGTVTLEPSAAVVGGARVEAGEEGAARDNRQL